MHIRPRHIATAASAAAVLVLAGCGGGSDDSASDAAATPSSSATSTTPSATASTSEDASGSAAEESLADLLARSMKDGRSAHVVFDLGSQGAGEGDVSFAGDSPAMQLRMKVAGQDTELRVVDGTVYVAMPGQDGKFVKMDMGQAGSMMGLDPSEALRQLEKRGGDAKDLGNGHWQLSKDGVTTDLFVGDDGYLERVEVESDGSQKITMTYSDWGKKVTVEAPARGEIVRAPGL